MMMGDDEGWTTTTNTKKKSRSARRQQHQVEEEPEPAWLSRVPSAAASASRATDNVNSSSSSQQQQSCTVVLLLVGLPGSGKSTFANKLVEVQKDDKWIRINQDELGGDRNRCMEVAMNVLVQNQKKKTKNCNDNNNNNTSNNIIIDRCNHTKIQRSYWIQLAKQFKNCRVECIYLNVPYDVCLQRCKKRKHHPTLSSSSRISNTTASLQSVVKRMQDDFIPTKSNEGFDKVTIINDDDDDIIKAFVSLL